MAMSISGSSSASVVMEACWEGGLGLGEAIVDGDGGAARLMRCTCCHDLLEWDARVLERELLMCFAVDGMQ